MDLSLFGLLYTVWPLRSRACPCPWKSRNLQSILQPGLPKSDNRRAENEIYPGVPYSVSAFASDIPLAARTPLIIFCIA
ncbi:hypothetical protein BJV74DRAFT_821820 [Russula compacta]|nr:hypothetical protein BJV74DRAFT_821820 [Russula compacta]